jgi:hypothetical protein
MHTQVYKREKSEGTPRKILRNEINTMSDKNNSREVNLTLNGGTLR